MGDGRARVAASGKMAGTPAYAGGCANQPDGNENNRQGLGFSTVDAIGLLDPALSIISVGFSAADQERPVL